MSIKSYTEMSKLETFEERFRYLKLDGVLGEETFGSERLLNQTFYRSKEWKKVRDRVILRDNGCDLGSSNHPIFGQVLIHHINPLTAKDITERSPVLFDMDNLICTTKLTHNAIHYGDEGLVVVTDIERKPNDTCPWRS